MPHKLLEIVQQKGPALGTFLGVTNVALMECLGYTGLDFVIIDTEHGPYDTQPMADLIKSAEFAGLVPFVRVADVTHKEIQRACDSGAQGIIVPCLREVEEFRRAVELAKFAPLGNRGFIKGRGSGFGNEPWAQGTLDDYMQNSNDRVLVLPQCETKESLEHIEEIVALPGLDGIFIGPFDLSISLGIPAQFDHPVYVAGIERIVQACLGARKLCLIFATDAEEARAYLAQGFDAVAIGIDANLYMQAYCDLVDRVRE